jgi:outer membrane protein
VEGIMKKNYGKLFFVLMYLFVFIANLFARSMSLDEAIKMAKDNSAELKIANLEVALIKNSVLQFRTTILPKINLVGDRREDNTFDYEIYMEDKQVKSKLVPIKKEEYDIKAQAEQKILDWAFLCENSSMKLNYRSAQADVAQKEADIAYNVSNVYYTLMKGEQTKKILEEDIACLEEYLKDVQEKVDLQFEQKQSIINTQINLQNKKQELYQHTRDYITTKTEFARMLLLPLTLDFSLSDFDQLSKVELVSVDKTGNEKAFNKAMLDRSDVKKLNYSRDSILKKKKSIAVGNLPVLSVLGSYGYLNDEKFRVNQEDKYWSIYLRATINIFNGFSDSLSLKEQNIKYEKANKEIENLKQSIESEINNTLYYMEELEKMHTDAQKSLKLAKENLETTEKKYTLRETTKEDILSAKLVYNDSKLQYMQTKIDLLSEYKKYQYLTGDLK